jgi:hypothetical protein
MVAPVRSNRVALRRAVIASAVLHVALAAGVVLVSRAKPESKPARPGIDTGADVVVRMFDATPALDARAPEPPMAVPSTQTAEPRAVPVEETGGLRPPLATIVPRTLPGEMVAVISRSVASQHVAGASPAVRAIHGAMQPGQTVVYVLDCSGSMGEFGKLELARAALLATLRAQPDGVRFQVIAYNSTARPLAGNTGSVPATPANVAAVGDRLLTLEAKGRSSHSEAIRAAARFRPDVVVLLTDAEGLTLAQFKSALAPAGKAVAVYVAKATASAVGTPQELR